MKVLFFAVALFLSAGAGAAGGGPRSCRADSELVRFVVPFRRYGLLDARFGHRV